MNLVVFTLTVYHLLGSILFTAVPSQRQRLQIPSIARIGDVIVGVSSVEDLERRFGPGRAYVGGHPHGSREWYVKNVPLAINTDGFNYNKKTNGRVIDHFDLNWLTKDDRRHPRTGTRYTSLNPKQFTFLGSIRIGMARSDVSRVLQGKPKPTHVTQSKITWKQKGYSKLNAQITYRSWRAEVRFFHKRVRSITLQCSTE